LKNENDVNKHYILDTSAYFTLFEDEEGSDTVQNILIKNSILFVHPINHHLTR
jgi:PIN domain nuclease of toxin-antitoxin system